MTHLEAATLNAQNFASGLAALQQFEEMRAKSDAIMAVGNDRDEPLEIRVEALKEARQLNQTFSTVAMAREMAGGISA